MVQFFLILELTALKLMEEALELAQVISKFRGMNGEDVVMGYDDIDEKVKVHIEKSIKKGYMKG
jgi:NTP pyrophosphatase (non-canonical NTP hydrolase)